MAKNNVNLTPVARKILAQLENGKVLSTTQIRARYGIVNVSARISEIRDAGFNVFSDMRKNSFGETVAFYSL